MDAYSDTAYAYTGTKLAFTLQAAYAPHVAIWGYLTNSGRYAQYKAAEQAFNATLAKSNATRIR